MVSQNLNTPTADQNSIWVDAADGTTVLSDFDVPKGTHRELYVSGTQQGMLVVSQETGEPGFYVGCAGEGSDDDVYIVVQVKNMLGDGQTIEHRVTSAQGGKFIPLPGYVSASTTSGSRLEVRIQNPTDATNGTDVTTFIYSHCLRAKSAVAAAGQRSLINRGVPVGSAKDSFIGAISEMIEAGSGAALNGAWQMVRGGANNRDGAIAAAQGAAEAVRGKVKEVAQKGFRNFKDKGAELKGKVQSFFGK